MKDIDYETVALVLESWEMARRCSNEFDKDFGCMVVDRLLEIQPRVRSVFGYDEGDACGDMGPDQEFIEDILHQVGTRHKKMNIKASFFPYMGDALIHALKKSLGEAFTDAHQEAWNELYDIISGEIVKAILAH